MTEYENSIIDDKVSSIKMLKRRGEEQKEREYQ